jgi:type IV pilus assembly protein PilM
MSPAPSSGRSWFATPPPQVAIEIAGRHVTAVAMADQGGRHVVTGHAVEPLAPGVAEPSLNAPNIHDEPALSAAIAAVLERIGHRTRRVGLVLPDSTAKISLIRFEKVPEKAQDLEQLIRWQVRKTAPFRIEDAQVGWQPGARLPDSGREYLVTLARRDIVRGYERVCEAAGLQAGLVDIASFNQINAVLAGGGLAADWLLVSVAADYATLAVVRGEDVVFFRNRSTAGEGDLPDLVHQTAMYHEDRLGGGGFARVILAGASYLGADESVRLRRSLEERIGVAVHPIDFRPAAELADRIGAGPELLDLLSAPVGLLVRERPPGRATRVAS